MLLGQNSGNKKIESKVLEPIKKEARTSIQGTSNKTLELAIKPFK